MWETHFSFTILELFTEIIRILMGLVIMKFGNLSGYKILNTQVFFGYLVLFKSWATLEFWFVVVIKCYSLEFWRYKMCIFSPWLMFLFVSPLPFIGFCFECLWYGIYSFCFVIQSPCKSWLFGLHVFFEFFEK